jgi:hypothetical protein
VNAWFVTTGHAPAGLPTRADIDSRQLSFTYACNIGQT